MSGQLDQRTPTDPVLFTDLLDSFPLPPDPEPKRNASRRLFPGALTEYAAEVIGGTVARGCGVSRGSVLAVAAWHATRCAEGGRHSQSQRRCADITGLSHVTIRLAERHLVAHELLTIEGGQRGKRTVRIGPMWPERKRAPRQLSTTDELRQVSGRTATSSVAELRQVLSQTESPYRDSQTRRGSTRQAEPPSSFCDECDCSPCMCPPATPYEATLAGLLPTAPEASECATAGQHD